MAKGKETRPTMEAILTQVVERAPEYFVVLGSELEVYHAAASFRDATGVADGSTTSFLDTVEQFSLSRVRKVFEQLRAGSETVLTLDINHRRKDGETVTVAYSWFVVQGEDGEFGGFAGIGRERIEPPQPEASEQTEALLQEVETLKSNLEKRVKEIHRLRKEIENRAKHDDMTGLGNRRHLLESLEQEASRAIRYDQPLTLVMVDVDRMTHVNDAYGQEKGDEVLSAVSEVVKEQIRGSDIAGRYSGEEFLVLCPHTDRPSAQFLAERLRLRVSELYFTGTNEGDEEEFSITVSIGLVTVTGQNEFDIEAILHAAEQALESAKTGGMNRVRVLEVI